MASGTTSRSRRSSGRCSRSGSCGRGWTRPSGARTEPIAIVGLGCRFPGGADDPEAFWRLLRDGVDADRRSAAERWDVDALYDPDPDAPGKMAHASRRLPRRTSTASTPRSSASRRARRAAWTRSSGCCSRWPGRRSRTPASPPDRLAGSRHRRVRRHRQQRLLRTCMRAGATDDQIDAYTATGNRARASRPAGSRTCSACRARAWRSTPPARRRWSRSTSPARACARGECDLALAGGVNLILSPELTDRLLPGAACWRRTAAARRSTPPPTATSAARAAAWWCSSGCADALADGDRDPRGDPRLGGQPGRPQRRADRRRTARRRRR